MANFFPTEAGADMRRIHISRQERIRRGLILMESGYRLYSPDQARGSDGKWIDEGGPKEHVERVARVVDRLIDREAGGYYGNRAGFCNQCNGILGEVAARLGYPVELLRGYVGDNPDHDHLWARIGGVQADIAGEQFGHPKVHVFTHDAAYHMTRTERPGQVLDLYPEDRAIVDLAVAELKG